MTNTSDISQFLYDTTDINRTTLGLPVNGLYFGDQVKIPATPCVCVDEGEKNAELNGAPRRTMNIMTVYVLVFHSQVKSGEANQHDNVLFAENLEGLYNFDETMADQVITSMVTRIEYGYQERGGVLYRASRLTIEAKQQDLLPVSYA